jgi:hypothetical protein
MKTIIAVLAVAFLAVTPAAAESAASIHAPGHQLKGAHGQPGASYWAPGHRKTGKSARSVAPGYKYER